MKYLTFVITLILCGSLGLVKFMSATKQTYAQRLTIMAKEINAMNVGWTAHEDIHPDVTFEKHQRLPNLIETEILEELKAEDFPETVDPDVFPDDLPK